eukprot:COSAG04_NODE_2337_length_4306_cov_17.637271_5_plen_76_part_00
MSLPTAIVPHRRDSELKAVSKSVRSDNRGESSHSIRSETISSESVELDNAAKAEAATGKQSQEQSDRCTQQSAQP